MALLHCHVSSATLGMQMSMNVILPQQAPPPGGHPVLWLLHGLSDSHQTWTRNTSIERYVEQTGLAVIMPDVHRSFYCDMVYGGDYWSYVSEELPALAANMFPISQKKEDTYVAGLSMGGYGAFKLALRQPERFAAAASLSGVLDLRARIDMARADQQSSLRLRTLELVTGHRELLPENNPMHWALEIAGKGTCPPLLQICGSSDFLVEDNRRFQSLAAELGLPITYMEQHGDHNWAFWDQTIQQVLGWIKRIRGQDGTISPAG